MLKPYTMTIDEATQMTEDIGNVAEDLLMQLNQYKIHPTYVEEFYLGLLARERIILRDVSGILRNNNERHLTSVFILLRVLLDDFIRLFSVYAREEEMEEEIVKISADAYDHRFKNINYSVGINNTYYGGLHQSMAQQKMYDDEKQKILDNSYFDKFFVDKPNFKFKRLTTIADVFKLMSSDVKTKSNVNANIVYKFLTQHVHYSNLTFYLDNDHKSRKVEIDQIEEILLYAIKMLVMQFDFFRKKYSINWNDTKVSNYFNSKTIIV